MINTRSTSIDLVRSAEGVNNESSTEIKEITKIKIYEINVELVFFLLLISVLNIFHVLKCERELMGEKMLMGTPRVGPLVKAALYHFLSATDPALH